MALGFQIPKINFISITLDGGTDLLKKTDEPHIAQEGETAIISADLNNPSQANGQNVEPMSIDLVLSADITFDMSSANIYSVFFEDDFLKYLKIRVIQSTNAQLTNKFANTEQLKKAFDQRELDDLSTRPGLQMQIIDFASYEGTLPEKQASLSSYIEVKTTSDGKKSYSIPYRVTFEVPVVEGGISSEHLAYFSIPYVDINQILQDKTSLGFGNASKLPDSMKNGMSLGPITHQTVIQGGTINNFAQIFYVTPEAGEPLYQLWTGRVHYHDAQNPGPNGYIGYMAGGTGEDMGSLLTPVTVNNGVIQDFREVKELEKINFDYSLFSNSLINDKTTERLSNNLKGIQQLAGRDNPYMKDTEDVELAIIKSLGNNQDTSIFTQLYTSMDGKGNTKYIFGVNFKQALKKYSAFPKLIDHLLENTTDSEKEKFFNRKILEEIKIYRYRVHKQNPADPTIDLYEKVPNETPKLVCTAAENSEGVLIPNTQERLPGMGGTIKQIFLNLPDSNESYTKFYTGTDLNIPSDGHYMYLAEIIMQDPIIDWMKSEIDALEQQLYGNEGQSLGFNDYLEKAKEKTEYYNLHTNRFTQVFIDEIEEWAEPGFAEEKITNFLTILTSFTSFETNNSINSLYNFLTAISSVNFGSPSGAQKAFDVMENIHKKILDAFSSVSKYKKPVDSQHVESVYSAGSNPSRKFTIEKKFSNKIKGETNHLIGYDYLSQRNTIEEETSAADGLRTLTHEEYSDRSTKELRKIFPNPPLKDESLGLFNTIKIFKTPLADASLTSQDYVSIIANLYQELLQKQNHFDRVLSDLDMAKEQLEALPPPSPAQFSSAYAAAQAKVSKFEQSVADADKALKETREEILTAEKGESSLKALQGEVLNPDDSVEFTKTAFLSPSIINFSDSASHNMLQDGNIRTDIDNLNNILLNIVKYNLKLNQKFDISDANTEKDQIQSGNNPKEVKYDLVNLLSDRQATIQVAQTVNSAISPSPSVAGTNFGPVFGGSSAASANNVKKINQGLLVSSNIAIGANDAAESTLQSATALNSILKDPSNILNSNVDPSELLLSIVNERLFQIFSDSKWSWEYYVQDFQDTFFNQYVFWTNFSNYWKGLSQSFGNSSLVPIDPFILDNSPLKRAPNHVKSLMLHLDWTKNFINSDFEELKDYLKSKKPYAYNYELTEEQISDVSINGSYNFLGVSPNANQTSGISNYPKIPKMKAIYESPEFISFFLLNYKNVVKIEVLRGYNYDGNGNMNINDPIWSLLTEDLYRNYQNTQGTILCRIMPYEDELYGIKRHPILEMPIYNKFFTIDFTNAVLADEAAPEEEPTRVTRRQPAQSKKRDLTAVFNFLKATKANSSRKVRAEQLNNNNARNTIPSDRTTSTDRSASSVSTERASTNAGGGRRY